MYARKIESARANIYLCELAYFHGAGAGFSRNPLRVENFHFPLDFSQSKRRRKGFRPADIRRFVSVFRGEAVWMLFLRARVRVVCVGEFEMQRCGVEWE